MEEKRNFDKENNNTNPKQQDKTKPTTTRMENDLIRDAATPPPPYQAIETNEMAARNTNQQRLQPQRAGRPATLLIVPKFFEDRQNNNNNNLENRFRDTTLFINTTTTTATKTKLNSADAADKKRDFDINKNNNNNNNNHFINHKSIDTLNTAYTYQGTSCTSESMLTIGGVTLNQGSHSFDLESNFSRMVLGSQGTSSTLSALNGNFGKRSNNRKRDLLNFAHFLNSPRVEGLQQPIRPATNIWFEAQNLQKTIATAKQQQLELSQVQMKKAEKKEKKKRLGPPPQVRNQASRQMDDPMANRPRTQTKDKKSKKEQRHETIITANEKY